MITASEAIDLSYSSSYIEQKIKNSALIGEFYTDIEINRVFDEDIKQLAQNGFKYIINKHFVRITW